MGADASGVRAGRAFVEIGANDNKLQAALKMATAKLRSWGQSLIGIGATLGGAGAAIVAPLTYAVDHFRHAGGELSHISAVTGISTNRLGEMQAAAVMLGGSLEDVSHGVQHMSRFLYNAAESGGAAEDALRKLHLSVSDVMALSPDQAFIKIGEAIGKMQNPIERDAIAMQVFGRSGAEMMKMLSAGSGKWEDAIARAREMGLVMSGEDIAAAKSLNGAWKMLTLSIDGLWNKIGAALAPSVEALIRIITDVVVVVSQWVDNNRPLIAMAGQIGGALVAVGSVLGTIGGAFLAAATVVGGLATGIGFLVSVVTTVGGFILTAAGAVISFVAAAIPLIPVIALVAVGLAGLVLQAAIFVGAFAAAAGAVYAYWDEIVAAVSEAVDTVIETARQLWDRLVTAAVRAQKMIRSLIGEAFDQVAAAVTAAWDGAVAAMRTAVGAFVSAAAAAWDAVKTAAGAAWDAVKSAAGSAFAWMSEKWAAFSAGFSAVWGTIVGSLGEGKLEDAFKVAMAALRLLWVQTTNWLHIKWVEASNWIADTFEVAWANVVAGIKTAWSAAVTWMGQRLIDLLDYLPGPLRRQLVGDVSTEQLRAGLAESAAQEQRGIQTELSAATDPNRASVQGRQQNLENVRAAGGEREAAAQDELERARREAEYNANLARMMRAKQNNRRGAAGTPEIPKVESLRGTFSGAALEGLSTSSTSNPVVDAVRDQTKTLEDVRGLISEIHDRLAEGMALAAG